MDANVLNNSMRLKKNIISEMEIFENYQFVLKRSKNITIALFMFKS